MDKLFTIFLPLAAKEHWKNGVQRSVCGDNLSSSEKLPVWSPKYSSHTGYMILAVI